MNRLAFVLAIMLACLAGQNAAAAETRIALVIGNSAYKNVTPLTNPANDAKAMAASLAKVGFTLVDGHALLDLDKQAMEQAIYRFGKAIRGADVGLFFYAGHGVQVDGKNYLIPVTADIQTRTDVKYHLVDADFVLDEMTAANTRTNVMILDACRNNPFGSRGLRGANPGLAQMNAPKGTLIAYSTAPGKVAADGTGANSPYTAALSRSIEQTGQRIEDVFIAVRQEVDKTTGGDQSPWESTNLHGVFYFLPPAKTDAPVATGPGAETLFWQSIMNSANPAMFEAYLKSYPQGQFAALARIKTEELKSPHGAAPETKPETPERAPEALPEDSRATQAQASPDQAQFDALLAQSLDHFNKNELDKALELGEAAIKMRPGDPMGYVRRASALTRKGDKDKGLADFEKALTLDPNCTPAYNNRGNVWLKAKEFDKALADYSKAIAIKPDNPLYYANRASAYRAMGDLDKAIADNSKALEIKSDYTLALSNRGDAWKQKGSLDKAAADYSRVIELKPDDATAYFNRAYVLQMKKDSDQSLADYSKAIAIKADYYIAYNNRGNIFKQQKDYDKAVADYSKALEIKPDYTLALSNRADSWKLKGFLDNAVADYSRVIELRPDDATAYFNRAFVLNMKKDLDRALADYSKAIAIKPDYYAAYNNRGIIYRDKKYLDLAIDDYSRAIAIKPDYVMAYSNRAAAFTAKHQNEAAKADTAKVKELEAQAKALAGK